MRVGRLWLLLGLRSCEHVVHRHTGRNKDIEKRTSVLMSVPPIVMALGSHPRKDATCHAQHSSAPYVAPAWSVSESPATGPELFVSSPACKVRRGSFYSGSMSFPTSIPSCTLHAGTLLPTPCGIDSYSGVVLSLPRAFCLIYISTTAVWIEFCVPSLPVWRII